MSVQEQGPPVTSRCPQQTHDAQSFDIQCSRKGDNYFCMSVRFTPVRVSLCISVCVQKVCMFVNKFKLIPSYV